MFPHYYRRVSMCRNLFYPFIQIRTNLKTLKPFSSLLHLTHFSSSSSSQNHHSFTVNYFINNYGISPEIASKLSHQVHFQNSSNPDSVLALFKTYGFSNAQLSSLIHKCPKILAFDPNKTILPKLNFLLSKGASTSDIVHIVTKNSRFLYLNLNKTIIPCYDFLKSFMLSDELIIKSLKISACLLYSKNPVDNVQLLLQNGVPQSKIALMFPKLVYILPESPHIFENTVKEVKELGFNPNTTFFFAALRAKLVSKSHWESKIDLYKKWGWSQDNFMSAFLKYPYCMLASLDKIEAVMQFFVNHMGWDSHLLAKHPVLIMLSLEKRVIPRAFVLQFLESRGLIKDTKSAAPYKVSEEMFLKKFVNRYEKEAPQLLNLYEEKISLPSKVVP